MFQLSYSVSVFLRVLTYFSHSRKWHFVVINIVTVCKKRLVLCLRPFSKWIIKERLICKFAPASRSIMVKKGVFASRARRGCGSAGRGKCTAWAFSTKMGFSWVAGQSFMQSTFASIVSRRCSIYSAKSSSDAFQTDPCGITLRDSRFSSFLSPVHKLRKLSDYSWNNRGSRWLFGPLSRVQATRKCKFCPEWSQFGEWRILSASCTSSGLSNS